MQLATTERTHLPMAEPRPEVLRAAPAKPAKRRARTSLLERYGSLAFALLILLIWQLAVPLLGLSEFVLPTPWAIARRMVKDAALLSTHA